MSDNDRKQNDEDDAQFCNTGVDHDTRLARITTPVWRGSRHKQGDPRVRLCDCGLNGLGRSRRKLSVGGGTAARAESTRGSGKRLGQQTLEEEMFTITNRSRTSERDLQKTTTLQDIRTETTMS